jgi:hypothetical protein
MSLVVGETLVDALDAPIRFCCVRSSSKTSQQQQQQPGLRAGARYRLQRTASGSEAAVQVDLAANATSLRVSNARLAIALLLWLLCLLVLVPWLLYCYGTLDGEETYGVRVYSAFVTMSTVGFGAENAFFVGAVSIRKRSICQDRLGTNIVEERMAFSAGDFHPLKGGSR